MSKEKPTALHGVPTMFIAELNHPDFSKYDLSSLRTGIMGEILWNNSNFFQAGSPCPKEVMVQVIEKMHMKDVTICYGMTETSPVSFQVLKVTEMIQDFTKTLIDDPMQKRVETVGRIHPHVEVKIVNPEGQVLPVESPGEILTRGLLLFLKEVTCQVFCNERLLEFAHTNKRCY